MRLIIKVQENDGKEVPDGKGLGVTWRTYEGEATSVQEEVDSVKKLLTEGDSIVEVLDVTDSDNHFVISEEEYK